MSKLSKLEFYLRALFLLLKAPMKTIAVVLIAYDIDQAMSEDSVIVRQDEIAIELKRRIDSLFGTK